MSAIFWIGTIIVIIGLLGLLTSERLGNKAGVWITKPLASTGFIIAALGAGALQTPYGIWIFVALVFCLCGDVLLIPDSKPIFLGGLVSFLVGHIIFVAAFFVRGVDTTAFLVALPLVAIPSLIIWRWLHPHLIKGGMVMPVAIYITVITIMVASGVGAFWPQRDWLILCGAVLFYISDGFVARDQFVSLGFVNKVGCLPNYYLAQLLLAASVLPATSSF
jgi:Predicted membrane protein